MFVSELMLLLCVLDAGWRVNILETEYDTIFTPVLGWTLFHVHVLLLLRVLQMEIEASCDISTACSLYFKIYMGIVCT